MAALRRAADREGYRALARIADEWAIFATADASGVLLGAWYEGALIGVGGLTPDPADGDLRRMRRFYIHPDHRRRGFGRQLALALLDRVAGPVVLRAPDARAALFWERLGFVLDPGPERTHRHPGHPWR
jgi:GNAT superfamily N-acetyltransferase